ncbi:MAG: hypothetical protein U0936_01465 [Planctomycetaceae bacterium]
MVPFTMARNGFSLTIDEQQRRFAILMLLQASGLHRDDYKQRFGHDILADLPELSVLSDHGLAVISESRSYWTHRGLERSDAVGPWLYSNRVCRLMHDFALV